MRNMHAPGPKLPCQALRQRPEREFPCREARALRASFEGGGGAGEDQGWGVGWWGGGGGGGEEEGQDGAGEEEGATAGGRGLVDRRMRY